MEKLEIFGALSTLAGIAFGFGKQHNSISTLKKDTHNIAELHRLTLDELNAIRIELAGVKKDIEYIKERQCST